MATSFSESGVGIRNISQKLFVMDAQLSNAHEAKSIYIPYKIKK